MIKSIKSKLSFKVFMLTFFLMAVCCAVTYLCIVRFSPYIYSHELFEAEEIADMLSIELSHAKMDEAQYIIPGYNDILFREYDDEFVFHIFQGSGEELALPDLHTLTGKRIEDYKNTESSGEYKVAFTDRTDQYTLILSKNTNKESQVIEALQKSLPILSVVALSVSIIAAFFYTWYMTKPIKKISITASQMADLNFNGLCPVGRTDEIGVLSESLNKLSANLSAALSELKAVNQKLQADIEKERELDQQRLEFFSAASHELKTPITIIKGQLQGMLCQVGRYKDRDTYLAESLAVTNTLEKMVQELLTISRLETPGYACTKSRLDFGRLVLDRLTAHEDLFAHKEMFIHQWVSSDIFLVGNLQLLQIAIDNILCNAAIYSPSTSHIFVKLWIDQEQVNFSVENTDVHIPDEAIPKLFEAFYRAEQSRNRKTGGSGLGLYITKTILDLHQANIHIANSERGVIVTVCFQNMNPMGDNGL